MLGRELRRRLSEHTVQEADLPDWDITDSEGIFSKIEAFAPDAVIHCAAMTKVDDCETNKDLAFRINEEGSRNVALACAASGARLIAVSTDYVFFRRPSARALGLGRG